MSSDISLQVDGAIVVLSFAFSLLAAYRSYIARRLLRRPIYRSHALWMMLIGVIVPIIIIPTAYFELTGTVLLGLSPFSNSSYSATPELLVTYALTIGVPLVLIWAWLDRSIEVALDMDFMHRDSLWWRRRVRWLAWASILVLGVVGVFLPVSTTAYTGQIDYIFLAGFAIPVAYAAIVLAIGVRRVRDVAMKTYIKWVGIMCVSILVLIFSYPYNSPIILFSYALYRASGSFTKTSPLELAIPTSGTGR